VILSVVYYVKQARKVSTIEITHAQDKDPNKLQHINSTFQPTFELTVGCGELPNEQNKSDSEVESPFELAGKDLN
jgi:hypothetical protein